MGNNLKNTNVGKLRIEYEGEVHEFNSFNSPFVCENCENDPNCKIVIDGFSEEPIDLQTIKKHQREFKYESVYFYGEAYTMDILVFEIRIVNSYAFTILLSRESPFSEIHMDFHEITSPTVMTPKFIHQKILESIVCSAREVEIFQKVLKLKRPDKDKNKGLHLNFQDSIKDFMI